MFWTLSLSLPDNPIWILSLIEVQTEDLLKKLSWGRRWATQKTFTDVYLGKQKISRPFIVRSDNYEILHPDSMYSLTILYCYKNQWHLPGQKSHWNTDITKALPSVVMTLSMEPFSFHLLSYLVNAWFPEQLQFTLFFNNNICTDCFHSKHGPVGSTNKTYRHSTLWFYPILERSPKMASGI